MTLVLSLATLALNAVPARRGVWRTATLSDGSTVRVELRGDEHLHYWESADGRRFLPDGDGRFREIDTEAMGAMRRRAQVRREGVQTRRRAALRRVKTNQGLYEGNRRGLVILVEFADKSFQTANDKVFFTRVANELGFREGNFKGSVKDYFLAQSNGRFVLDFDVVGPVKLPNGYAYYGKNDGEGNEPHAVEMVKEACEAAADSVDFGRYDWDGDGYVDQVYVLYAGHGEADYGTGSVGTQGDDDVVWPHEWTISSATTVYDSRGLVQHMGKPLELDGVKVDTYACSNELDYAGKTAGVGTMCHEFTHCLGLPDFYDTSSQGSNFGMGDWDLMCSGSYNGDSYRPAGYTAYEKMVAGWLQPVELKADTLVADMKPMSEHGASYIIRNDGHDDEYYLVENRQRTGWDTALPGRGLLVTHVDYDEKIWFYNEVNTTGSSSYTKNNHQRLTIFHADNSTTYTSQQTDLYPYGQKDSLTATSVPAARLYHSNASGKKLMDGALLGIQQQGGGLMTFRFRANGASGGGTVVDPSTEVLLHETFDQCAGNGGNDNQFSGQVASAVFTPDLSGWTDYVHAYGGKQCARFGTSASVGSGMVTSPAFTLPGDTVALSFRAAGWDARRDGMQLLLTLNGGNARFVGSNATDTVLTMAKGQWEVYKFRLAGKGSASLTFSPSNRFFLDDVLVERPLATGIRAVERRPQDGLRNGRIYTLGGQYVGVDLQRLPHGVYIQDGRKVVR